MIWGFAGISGSFLVAVFSVNQLHAAVPVYRLAFSQRAPRNTRPHEVGGGRTVRLRWFHARIHVLHCRVCFPRRSRLRLDNQRAARPRCLVILLPMGCRTSSPTSPRRQGAPVHSSTVHHPGYNRQRCTPYVAVHPLRRATPVTSRCTRSEGVQCQRIGCTTS